jgi:hypothetical protein
MVFQRVCGAFVIGFFGLLAGPASAGTPSVSGGCSPGLQVVELELGQGLPLPNHYSNPTGSSVTFTGTINDNAIFGPSHVVFSLTLSAHTGQTSSEPPVVPTDFTTPLVSDHVVIDITSSATGSTVLASCDYQVTMVPPAELQDLIQVPVRWCILQGSPQAQGKAPGEILPGTKLLALIQKLNTVWVPGARIAFRPAFSSGIPVIADPIPTDNDFLNVGDIDLSGFLGSGEPALAASAGEQAWLALAPSQRGVMLVNVNRMPGPSLILGVAPAPSNALLQGGARHAALCSSPRQLLVSDLTPQFTAVVDQALYTGVTYPSGADMPHLALAHELGHVLLLGHGNGFDDDQDGVQPPANGPRLYDEYCDDWPAEDTLTPSVSCEVSSSMMQTSAGCPNLRPHQIEAARAAAKLVPGALFGASAALLGGSNVNGSLVAGETCPAPACGLPGHVYIARADLGLTQDVATLQHTLLAGVPAGIAMQYLQFLDVDGDPSSGGAPASLGFPTAFAGAELVTRVSVSRSAGGWTATPTVWRHEGGGFVEVGDPAIRAEAFGQVASDAPVPLSGTVTVSLPQLLVAGLVETPRLQALAFELGAGGALHRIPSAPDAGGLVSLAASAFPECSLFPLGAPPGEVVSIHATGLPGGQSVDLLLGDRLVSSGQTDGAGTLDDAFVVPSNTPEGLVLVTAVVRDTLFTSGCGLLVSGDALTPATTATLDPEPNGGGWNKTDVVVHLAAVEAPGGPGIAGITYSSTGAEVLAETTVAGAAADVPFGAEGESTLGFFATSSGGSVELPESAIVRIDKGAPTVAFSGNAVTYDVHELVDIECTASDAVSGVMTENCPDVSAQAYTFGLGLHTVSASAEDFAGNVGLGSTSFTVVVTHDGLCALSLQFVTNPGLQQANAMCAQLAAAEQAAADGNLTAEAGAIKAYKRIVTACWRAGFLTQAQVTILNGLADAL